MDTTEALLAAMNFVVNAALIAMLLLIAATIVITVWIVLSGVAFVLCAPIMAICMTPLLPWYWDFPKFVSKCYFVGCIWIGGAEAIGLGAYQTGQYVLIFYEVWTE